MVKSKNNKFDGELKLEIILKNCDYKKLISEIKHNKIIFDLVLTDPPYCVSRSHQLGFSNMGRAGMNYGSWDYNFNQQEWIDIVSPFVKNGGSMIIFNDWKHSSILVEALERNNFVIKDLLRWEKKNPMPRNVNSRYLADCEFAIWAVKGLKSKWTFNKPQKVPYLKPVYKSGVVPGGKKRIHPTQKHLEVIKEILKVHSNENDLVFDPFAGSGTTAVACKDLNRNFIGSEIDKNYYLKAMDRL